MGGNKLIQDKLVHREICDLLLTSYESLKSTMAEYAKLLPSWQQTEIKKTALSLNTLSSLNDVEKVVLHSITSYLIHYYAPKTILSYLNPLVNRGAAI